MENVCMKECYEIKKYYKLCEMNEFKYFYNAFNNIVHKRINISLSETINTTLIKQYTTLNHIKNCIKFIRELIKI